MIVNDVARTINKLDASLTDNASVINFDCHMFIVQATDGSISQWFSLLHLFKTFRKK
jgi:hypothetical protein